MGRGRLSFRAIASSAFRPDAVDATYSIRRSLIYVSELKRLLRRDTHRKALSVMALQKGNMGISRSTKEIRIEQTPTSYAAEDG